MARSAHPEQEALKAELRRGGFDAHLGEAGWGVKAARRHPG